MGVQIGTDADGEPVGPLAPDQDDAEDGDQRRCDRRRVVRRHGGPRGAGDGRDIFMSSPGRPDRMNVCEKARTETKGKLT